MTDLGLFGPGTVTWRVHAEPILFVGGLRSLYLQALHPRAMAGVAQNSHYKDDPWGRLVRTSIYVATAVYGTTEEAVEAGRRLRGIHARMRARDPFTGEEFRIDEPELLRWVHVTEVESFITTAKRSGVPLTDAEVDTYYWEQRRVAALAGLDPSTVPASAAEVADYYESMRPVLKVTKDSAEALVFLTAPPVPWKLNPALRLGLELGGPRLAYLGIASTALGLLPGWARRLYGGLGLPIEGFTAGLSVRAIRSALAALPSRYTQGPIYQGAMARAAAAQV
ncbi:oxygenase MpaB family protein [Asanoa sp. NPDC049573]|uniref:oxygenase MpaB family protein n=1 Tax=Asanoa sp. NPDC049573 TaxID=3155396 RepID=UPI0034136176